jgi:hypothetical protein
MRTQRLNVVKNTTNLRQVNITLATMAGNIKPADNIVSILSQQKPQGVTVFVLKIKNEHLDALTVCLCPELRLELGANATCSGEHPQFKIVVSAG